MMIRQLEVEDAPAYRELRLRAVTEHPATFADTPAETPEAAVFAERLRTNAPYIVSFGAFEGESLVGMAVLVRNPRQKMRHRAELVSMYVAPEVRGQGIGVALVRAVIDHARTQAGLELLTLAVTVGNDSARQLYLSAGFQPWARDAHYFKVDGVYYDIEWMRLGLKD